ncbi:hypothetical protein L204_105122 [Cryptococcus depauperatus]|uniref:Putative specific HMG box transcriptional repressor n=1 Tax=Cryptococcus depauperatus TaxID=5208 RepID=D2JWU4_9TREE|nr:putative specific HMG box transcriptional repressor [Cryptococcus depauperatus]ODN96080.1 hypothetical protein L204_03771 [Cryptococcus depauperatus CBS 7855]
MSLNQYTGSSATSGSEEVLGGQSNSTPLTTPPSTHHSPEKTNYQPSTSPPSKVNHQGQIQVDSLSPENANQGIAHIAADDIDPALRDLANLASTDLSAKPQAEYALSWLPHLTGNPADDQPNQPLQLDTNVGSLPSTQPPSADTNSPASSIPEATWTNYSGSVTDLSNYAAGVGGEKQIMDSMSLRVSAASSESGFETGEAKDAVPPPQTKKKSHARKQPETHIKRARNAFILFRKHITDSHLIPATVEVKHQNISVVAAKMWKEAPQEVRQKFQEQARLEKEEHARKYPGYRYQPVFRRTDIIRRRVRKDPAEDQKVDAVAEALIQGKAGEALEKEIKEQLVTRSEASESETDSIRSNKSRRRREVGQLSKGAIRAQRAQARAKQMRQNLLGTNLLNMSLYNAANARLASTTANDYHAQQAAAAGMSGPAGVHGHTHPGMQYAMDSYLQMGYGLDGRPVQVGGYGGEAYGQNAQPAAPVPTGHEAEMYRLPPIDGMLNVGNGYEWQPPSMEYWEQNNAAPDMAPPANGYPGGEEAYYAHSYDMDGVPVQAMEYRLPPLMEASRERHSVHEQAPGDIIASAFHEENQNKGSHNMRQWTHQGQQTPSGHVMFNERLFDGALGSATMPERTGGEDGLGIFDQAIENAGEVEPW